MHVDWISADEKLPALGQKVLVWNRETQEVDIAELKVKPHARYWETRESGGYEILPEFDKPITHWIPLPQGPQRNS